MNCCVPDGQQGQTPLITKNNVIILQIWDKMIHDGIGSVTSENSANIIYFENEKKTKKDITSLEYHVPFFTLFFYTAQYVNFSFHEKNLL